jgi:hypothetical protein
MSDPIERAKQAARETMAWREATRSGDTLSVDLWYPPRRGEAPKGNGTAVAKIEVGLVDVRAADSILIQYDFDRDGYVIKQASRFAWISAEDTDQDWQEVAFVQAWARKETDEQEDERLSRDQQKPPTLLGFPVVEVDDIKTSDP